jgi:hypothetical protein
MVSSGKFTSGCWGAVRELQAIGLRKFTCLERLDHGAPSIPNHQYNITYLCTYLRTFVGTEVQRYSSLRIKVLPSLEQEVGAYVIGDCGVRGNFSHMLACRTNLNLQIFYGIDYIGT